MGMMCVRRGARKYAGCTPYLGGLREAMRVLLVVLQHIRQCHQRHVQQRLVIGR